MWLALPHWLSRPMGETVGKLEQVGHAVDASPPGGLQLVEELGDPAQGIAICADQALSALPHLGYQAALLQHRHVLLNDGKRHRVEVGEHRHGWSALKAATNDVPSGGVGESMEHGVGFGVGQSIYNHMVVRQRPHEPRKRAQCFRLPLTRQCREAPPGRSRLKRRGASCAPSSASQ